MGWFLGQQRRRRSPRVFSLVMPMMVCCAVIVSDDSGAAVRAQGFNPFYEGGDGIVGQSAVNNAASEIRELVGHLKAAKASLASAASPVLSSIQDRNRQPIPWQKFFPGANGDSWRRRYSAGNAAAPFDAAAASKLADNLEAVAKRLFQAAALSRGLKLSSPVPKDGPSQTNGAVVMSTQTAETSVRAVGISAAALLVVALAVFALRRRGGVIRREDPYTKL